MPAAGSSSAAPFTWCITGVCPDRTLRRVRRLAEQLFPWAKKRKDPTLEDIVAEAILDVVKGMKGFKPGRPLTPWLRRLVRNAGLRVLEWRRHREGKPSVEYDSEICSALAARDESGAATAEATDTSERQLRIAEQLMQGLSPQLRIGTTSKYGDETTRAVQPYLGIPAGTLRAWQCMAHRELSPA